MFTTASAPDSTKPDAMTAPDDRLHHARIQAERHLRIVRWLKFALPIGALILLAAIFVTDRDGASPVDPGTAARLAAMGTGMQLDNPRFSGETKSGDPFVVTAERALPDGALPDRIDLQEPVGKLRTGKRSVTVTAETGTFFRTQDALALRGNVVLRTSDGYRVEAPDVRIDLEAQTATSSERLRASGPNGTIEADKVRIVPESGQRDQTIRFEGDVEVNWHPAPRSRNGE